MMTPEQYVYWFNGFVEVTNGKYPSEAEWLTIKDHLAEVFVKKTPNRFNKTDVLRGAQYCSPIPPAYQLNPDGSPVRIDHSC